ncbi:ATP-binding protein [soil metagenome]
MEKPARLFDREREWEALTAFVWDARPGVKLAAVRGRRRHGKSVLLRALVEESGGFYHQALEGTAAEQLGDLGAAIAGRAGLPAALALPDWGSALDALLGEHAAVPSPVVLDEFSYLVAADASLPSVLQRTLDDRARRGPPTRLVVCGSALSIMSSLLVGSAPLRGRATVELPIRPFDYRQAAAFQDIADPRVAAQVYAVIGGVPGYSADLLDDDLPRTRADFDAWAVRGPLSVSRPLLYEARHLVDDPGVRDRSVYLSVLAALASGATTNGQVAQRLQRSTTAVAQPLATLADLGLVIRRDDPLRARRPTWVVLDPLLRLWAAVLRPDWTRLEQGRAEEVWRDAQARWRTQILGPTVEDLARTWTSRFARSFGRLRDVGAAVVNDPKGRTQHEIDVVGLDAASGRVAVIGEAKAGVVDVSDLRRLEQVRALLVARGSADLRTRLLLVGLEGPTSDLVAAADPTVELVDAARLYRGS